MNPTLDGAAGVRLALPGDEEDIFALLTMLHAENGFFAMAPQKVRAVIRCAISRVPDPTGALGMVGVIEKDGRVAGTIGLFIGQDWHTDDWALAERWNFVHPDYRKTDFAKQLIAFAKSCQEWFETSGHTMPLVVGIFSTVRTAAKVRLYSRWLPPAGAFFIYGKTSRQPADAQSTTAIPAKASVAPRPDANGSTLKPRSMPSPGTARH